MRSGRAARAAGLILAGALGLSGCGMGDAVVGIHDAPRESTSAASLDQASAQRIAARVLDDVKAAQLATGPQAAAQQKAVLTGAALAMAGAATATRSVADAAPALTKPSIPKILAVSKGKTWPRAILATTLDEADKRQYLYVLVSEEATAPFKLAAQVPMHSGASIPALADLTDGVQLVGADDAAGMAASPLAVLTQYAGALAQPTPKAAPNVATTDTFADLVRTSARGQIKALGKLGKLTETHTVVPADTISFRLANGGAVVFGLMKRTDRIDLAATAKELVLPPLYARLSKRNKVTKTVTITTYESVVAVVGSTDMAVVVGGDEQIASAVGH